MLWAKYEINNKKYKLKIKQTARNSLNIFKAITEYKQC